MADIKEPRAFPWQKHSIHVHHLTNKADRLEKEAWLQKATIAATNAQTHTPNTALSLSCLMYAPPWS